jgi:poly-gamma-glutamate capsule biosynthesis protein CapA/YwtB (metallophosphatase superfamily)
MNEETILFLGDFSPQGRVESLIKEKKFNHLFNDLVEEFQKSDLNVIDLECPLVDRGEPIKKTGPNLKGTPEAIHALQFLNVKLAAMANNHIMDFGAAAMQATRDLCESSGIATVGVGHNLSDARKPFIAKLKNSRVAILNITENEWSNTTGENPGANPLDLAKNFADIRAAKLQADYVILIYHGGNEFYHLPSPRVKETLRFFIDAGADAVITHHTHIVSGYEVYNGCPIFYSLGNFCFDWPGHRDTFWNTGMAVRLVLKKSIEFEIIPFKQNGTTVGILKLQGQEREQFFTNIASLNAIIADENRLARAFSDYAVQKRERYLSYIEPYRNALLTSLRKRKFIPSFLSNQKKRLLLNITRCEAHRDLLIEILSEKK